MTWRRCNPPGINPVDFLASLADPCVESSDGLGEARRPIGVPPFDAVALIVARAPVTSAIRRRLRQRARVEPPFNLIGSMWRGEHVMDSPLTAWSQDKLERVVNVLLDGAVMVLPPCQTAHRARPAINRDRRNRDQLRFVRS